MESGSYPWIAQRHSSKSPIKLSLDPAKFFFKKSCLEKVSFRVNNCFVAEIRLNGKLDGLILIAAKLRSSIFIRACCISTFLPGFV